MHDAYDDLPAVLKAQIAGLRSVHVYQSKYSPRSLSNINADSLGAVPAPGVHPLVRIHPENGRKALYLNPVRMESIVGMDDKDALALIDQQVCIARGERRGLRFRVRVQDPDASPFPSLGKAAQRQIDTAAIAEIVGRGENEDRLPPRKEHAMPAHRPRAVS